jgi:AraC-like DNA-binding protein
MIQKQCDRPSGIVDGPAINGLSRRAPHPALGRRSVDRRETGAPLYPDPKRWGAGNSVEFIAKPGASDKVYPPTKLALLVEALVSEGISADDALHQVGVPHDELHSAESLVSVEQLVTVCRNAIRLSRDPRLPFRIGSSIHVSAYGMYGYAILCGTDFRSILEFAVKYHVLAAPLGAISFTEHDRVGVWTFEPILHHAIDERLYRFIVELQISVHISLQRDIMGPSFAPSEIALTYPRAKEIWLDEEAVGCPVRYEQAANQMIFDSKWLDDPPKLGNRTTYTAVEKLCGELLSDLTLHAGVAGKIRMILLRDMANRPTFAAIARLLGVTTRTLRRQLHHQGMSHRQLVDELRTQVAVKYLRETIMTNEDIALALGFSDASNFRHAFRRSTGKTPNDFRRKAPSLGHPG